jgi:hypothetical protein
VVVPVKSQTPAKRKAARKPSSERFPLQSCRTLLTNLATMNKNRVQPKLGGVSVSFERLTTATSLQERACDLLGVSLTSAVRYPARVLIPIPPQIGVCLEVSDRAGEFPVNLTCFPNRKKFRKILNLVVEKACFIRAVLMAHPTRGWAGSKVLMAHPTRGS